MIKEREGIMKKTLALILALVMLFSMSTGSFAQSDAPLADKVRVAISSDVVTLDPLGDNAQGKHMVMPCFAEWLCILTEVGGELQPCIAKSWEQVDDYHIRATIYDYVYDTAGNHITASDVAYSYNKCIEKGMMAASLNMIDDVVAIDDYTVEFTVNTTAAGTLINTLTGCPIVSQAAYEADPEGMANNPICTGPYVVTEFIPGSTVKVKRSGNYWQTPELTCVYSQANVEEIEFNVVLEAAQLSMMLETGEVDIAGYLQENEVANFDGLDGYTTTSTTNCLSMVLLFNCDSSNVFANKALRQAVCYAIDNEAILQNVFGGKGSVNKSYGNDVYGDFVDKWYDEDYYDYDMEAAKAKLAEAGYEPGELHVKIMTTTESHFIRIGELVQAFLSTIGISSEIVSYESSLYNSYRFAPEEWDLRVDNKGAGDYITSVYKYSFDQDMFGGQTQNFYVDEEMQQLLETAMDEKTHTPENIDAVHQAIKESAIGYGLCSNMINYVSNDSKVKKVVYNWFQKAVIGACEFVTE